MEFGSDVRAGRLDPGQERDRHVHVTVSTWGATSIVLWPGSNPKAVRPERMLMSSPDDAQLWAQGQGLSPNGRWILFTVMRFHPTSIEPMVAPAGGAPQAAWVRIAPDHDSPDKPRWSADGKTIFFVSSARPLISICGRPASIPNEDSRLASRSLLRNSIRLPWSSLLISTARS
jgi:hypothetical protein